MPASAAAASMLTRRSSRTAEAERLTVFLPHHWFVCCAAPALLLLVCCRLTGATTTTNLVESGQLQKYVDEIGNNGSVLKGYTHSPAGYAPALLTIGMYKTTWKFHRDLPASTVFAYGTSASTASIPGPVIEAMATVKTSIRWENHLPDSHLFAVDPTIEAARPSHGGVPTAVHLHGAIVEPQSDGNPNAWFTNSFRDTGPGWKKATYEYTNSPDQVSLFYHDHALGLTRLNLVAGLAGPYKILNPTIDRLLGLPPPPFDTFLVITDRSFTRDGSIFVNGTGIDPSVHPNWQPEYFGDILIVNGKAWPFMKVKRRTYRFRILDASNARYYRLALDVVNGSCLHFTQIGSDSFYLEKPVNMSELLMGPAEISDVIVDFSHLKAGSEVLLTNSAPFPFPGGDSVNEDNGQVMKFVVVGKKVVARNASSCSGVPPPALVAVEKLKASEASRRRDILLTEETGEADVPTAVVINFAKFTDPATEKVKVGETEVWRVINLSEDNHPFHVHLVPFQVLSEQALSEANLEELEACVAVNKTVDGCHLESYYIGAPELPEANVAGWKSVYRVQPGHVTTLVIRFALPDSGPFSFDGTAEPGYVYHCHIIDHEDNMMMRPLLLFH